MMPEKRSFKRRSKKSHRAHQSPTASSQSQTPNERTFPISLICPIEALLQPSTKTDVQRWAKELWCVSCVNPWSRASADLLIQDTTTLVAQESRRERYTKMLETRWGSDWSLVLCKAKIISKRRSDRGISVTVIKHLAIMAYWVWDILEAIELLRVSITGRKSGASERNRAAHATANDVKSVLGAREDLEKKTWDDLADEALRGIEE